MSRRSSRSSRLRAPRITSTRAARIAVDVEGAQPLRDVRLRDAEARSGDHEMATVRLQVGIDLVELDVREVVRLDRMREARVHLLDLAEDRLRLLALGADRRVGRRGRPCRRAGTPRAPRGRGRGEEPVAVSGASCRVSLARRKARRWWGHRPQVGEPSSVRGRLHAQPTRKCLQTAQIPCDTVPCPVRGRARYLVPCVAAVILGATAGGSSGAPGRRRPARVARDRRSARPSSISSPPRRRSHAPGPPPTGSSGDARRWRWPATGRAPRRRSSEARSRRPAVRIATLLRRLYMDGDADPIAVLLGARSLPGMLAGIEALERATLRNRDLAAEARTHARTLRVRLERLRTGSRRALPRRSGGGRRGVAGSRQPPLRSGRRSPGSGGDSVSAAHASPRSSAARRRRSVPRRASRGRVRPRSPPSLRRRRPATAPAPLREPSAPRAPCRRAGRSSSTRSPTTCPGGRRAACPVGVGVIAVDPTVIPLGTRVFVPGYGPAVAADVGSAIKGAVIDLWMPSTAAARAWGRRTVTITVYG